FFVTHVLFSSITPQPPRPTLFPYTTLFRSTGSQLMAPGEIYLAKFPYGDAPGMKLRPVLLLTGPIGAIPEVLVAYISSVIPDQVLPSDLLLDPQLRQFSSTNLKVASALRLHKLATIH